MMRTGYEAQQYCLAHCPVSDELQNLSSKLISNQEIVNSKSKDKVIESKSGRWDKDEELYLINHFKHFNVEHLAIRLNREPASVYTKIKQLMAKKKINAC